ncbi:MAG: hypothetical protein PVH41_19615 [Anaerolineae bacterium]|jgi:hypothetical protein
MEHHFIIGETYRNRDGSYEVEELDGRRMVIRYTDGRRLETTVKLQARIWSNILSEEAIAEQLKPPGPEPETKPRSDRRGRKFAGLQDHDFQLGVAGTSWRARTALGGLLAREMSATTPYGFESHAVYRQPRVHIVRPDCYDPKAKWQSGKFYFALDSEKAQYGYHVERGQGPMGEAWDWPRFIGVLKSEATLRRRIAAAMHDLGLTWSIWRDAASGLAPLARADVGEDGLLSWQEGDLEAEELAWPAFADQVSSIEPTPSVHVFLATDVANDEAIAAGVQIVEPVTTVYRALLPLYIASTGKRSPGASGD